MEEPKHRIRLKDSFMGFFFPYPLAKQIRFLLMMWYGRTETSNFVIRNFAMENMLPYICVIGKQNLTYSDLY